MSDNALRGSLIRSIANCCLNKPVLAINLGGALTVKTTNAITAVINGIVYSITALAAKALLTPPTSLVPNSLPFYTLPIGKTCWLLLVTKSDGTIYCIQSDYLGRDLSAYGRPDKGQGLIPDVPDVVASNPLTDGLAPFGLIKVVATAATFLPGTDALDKANVAFTFYDIAVSPASSANQVPA
jgi:hypothetical protein